MVILPNEIIYLIFTYLKGEIGYENKRSPFDKHGPPKLAQYAVISRQWQAIVERIIWQQISVVKLGSVEKLHQFTSGDSYRRARAGYIRHILWWPKIEWGDFIAKFQGNDEHYAGYHQQCLSSIRNMFQLLSPWEGQLSDIHCRSGWVIMTISVLPTRR